MKGIFFLTTAFLVLASFTASSQTGKVGGNIMGNNRQIDGATVSLLKAKDSSVVKLAISNKTGYFEIDKVRTGAYLLQIQAVGFEKYYSDQFEISDQKLTYSLSKVELQGANNKLKEVSVTARKQLIEQKIDRTVINVDASPTNVGSSALEVLEKSPGVTVDKDGNISLKGKEGVLILVDGRETHLSGADLANMLRNMHANQLDQIEIMTNPPARYDAAGNAGVINFKTKKNKQFGYNGSLTLGYGQGFYPKANEAFNLNYRKGKVNLFSNLSHNYHRGFNELDIQRNFFNSTSKLLESHFDQEARMSQEINSLNGKIGLDYFASKKTTWGLVVSGYSSEGSFSNRNLNLIYSPPGNKVGETRAVSSQEETWQNISTNLNFRRILDTSGREITADIDYMHYDTDQDHRLMNYYFNPDGSAGRKGDTLFGHLPQTIDINSGRIDYLHPLKKGAKFEAGVKASLVRTDNNAIYDNVHNGEVSRDLNRSNYFIYEENINAAYVNISGPLAKKWNGQLGLRLENTNAKGDLKTTGESFKRNYSQLFPTAFVQYKSDEKNSFRLNYGKRIRRPNYSSLNPFIEYLDKYTYEQGNPNLKPQFSHNIELSHSFKSLFTTTLNYTRTTDIIQQVIEQVAADTLTFIRQSNIADQEQYGVSISTAIPVNKWWTSNIYVYGFYNRFNGVVNGDEVTISATTVQMNGTQQFKLSKKASLELSGWYRTAALEGVIEAKNMGMMSIGYSQQVMNGKGTVRVNLRDVFYSQKFKASTRYGTVDAAFEQRRDSRVLNIGFTYRFSKGKMNGSQKRRTGSASEEESRVGGGN